MVVLLATIIFLKFLISNVYTYQKFARKNTQ